MKKLKLHTINTLFKVGLKRKYTSFMKSLPDAENCQLRYLFNLLAVNSKTHYGQKYQFSKIRSVRDYVENVPLIHYDDIAPEIGKIADGQPNVLFHEKALMFEKTSGSTAPSKYIPFNRSLLNEIHNATSAWIYTIYDRNKALSSTTSYWSISPRLGAQEFTKGGFKVGFADDSEYFGAIERKFIRHILAVDPALSSLDEASFYKALALSLICDEHLGLISIWNPSFFVLVLEYIEQQREMLLSELGKRPWHVPLEHLKRIAAVFCRNEKIDFQSLWPHLQLISCWTDGASAMFLPKLQRYFPAIPIQGKGLLMTEGVVTIPMAGLAAPVLCINSHFYEFIECTDDETVDLEGRKPTLLPHELEQDKAYIPVLTTGAGLYRYVTGDRVCVKGFVHDVPLLQFLGRGNNVVDLCGEKLSETFVAGVLGRISRKHGLEPDFAMLAPSLSGHPHYVFFLEQSDPDFDPNALAKDFDDRLRNNHHYDLCRKLGQLASLEVVRIKQGRKTYIQTINELKKVKLGHIKNKILDSYLFWKKHFIVIGDGDGSARQTFNRKKHFEDNRI